MLLGLIFARLSCIFLDSGIFGIIGLNFLGLVCEVWGNLRNLIPMIIPHNILCTRFVFSTAIYHHSYVAPNQSPPPLFSA